MRGPAHDIRRGDDVTVFAFPAGKFGTQATEVRGMVEGIQTIDLPFTTNLGRRITFDTGRKVDAVHYAVTEFHSLHQAHPDDDPEPGDRCKDCGRDITWNGPTQYDWDHVTEEQS